MTRGLLIAAFLLSLCIPASSQFNGCPAGFCPLFQTSGGGGGCSDSDASAWVTAVTGAGGTVSGAQQTRVCTLIVALKGHSIWNNLDRMWLYASENTFQANIDIRNRSSQTITGTTPTFTASQGYTGVGTSGNFINSNYVPSINGVNFTLTTSSLGVYILNNRTSSSNTAQLGALDAGSANPTQFQLNAFGNLWIGETNGQGVTTSSATTSQGFYIISQTPPGSFSEWALYRNGNTTPLGTLFQNASGPVANALYVMAANNNGTDSQNSTDQIAMWFVGGTLTSTDIGNISTDFNGGYMTSLGTNVY